MNKSRWGEILSIALLATGAVTSAIYNKQEVLADPVNTGATSGTTNVSVTFLNANLYIDAMPNFDFGINNNYRSGTLSVAEVSGDGADGKRYLQVSSPDAAVPFKVSLQNKGSYALSNNSPLDISGAFAADDESKSMGTLTLQTSNVKTAPNTNGSGSGSGSWSSVNSATDPQLAAGIGKNVRATVPLSMNDDINAPAPVDVLKSSQGVDGKVRVNFGISKSAQFVPGDFVNKLQSEYLAKGNPSITLVFPLFWTISIDSTTRNMPL